MNAYQKALRTDIPELTEQTAFEQDVKDFGDARRAVQPEPVDINFKMEWVKSTETQRMVAQLTENSNKLVDDAISLALINHQQDNAKSIIHKLIEANSLRKIIKTYASVH